jgi:hypothetical protein
MPAIHIDPAGTTMRWGSPGESLADPGSRLRVGLLGFATVASVALLALGSLPVPPNSGGPLRGASSRAAQKPSAAERQALDAYAKLPLTFVPNEGQADDTIRYHAQGERYSFSFQTHQALLAFSNDPEAASDAVGAGSHDAEQSGTAVALRFVGANDHVVIAGEERTTGTVNYLVGADSANWHTGLPVYERVVYRRLWAGIDMSFSGRGGRLKYDFAIAPGASVEDIRLAYRGADDLSLARNGGLVIRTATGVLRDAPPRSFQVIGGNRVPVESRFEVRGAHSYGFAIEGYDRRYPLIIDPDLLYSTYLGGTRVGVGESALGVAVDDAGRAFVTGGAGSTDFPTTPGAFDRTLGGFGDAFVTKLNPAGSALAYSTYLGGSRGDFSSDIAVDDAGRAYVTGITGSANFPTTPGSFDRTFGGSNDAFVTKLNPAGSALAYSTYLGAGRSEEGSDIAVDDAGRAYVTGQTFSAAFPTTPGSFDRTLGDAVFGFGDAFVTKLKPAGSALAYSTYLGGRSSDLGSGIAVDDAGRAYVTGEIESTTGSSDFPTTPGAFDRTLGGLRDAFVTKLNPAGSALAYSTYLGGRLPEFDSGEDFGSDIAVDVAGSAYVTGTTGSSDFPTTVGSFDRTLGGSGDAFVTKLKPAGSALAYSTYLGGESGGENGSGIALHLRRAYITGATSSADFPTAPWSFDRTFNGEVDAFMTKVDATGSALMYSTYLGGSNFDIGNGIAAGSAGRAYVAGSTSSSDFPTTPGAFDRTFSESSDGFVTKLDVRKRALHERRW